MRLNAMNELKKMFSEHFWPISAKKMRDRWTDRRTDRRTNPLIQAEKSRASRNPRTFCNNSFLIVMRTVFPLIYFFPGVNQNHFGSYFHSKERIYSHKQPNLNQYVSWWKDVTQVSHNSRWYDKN